MDPVNDYYGMDYWQKMLGLAGNPYSQYYQANKMQYMGDQQGQQQKQSSNPMSMYNSISSLFASPSVTPTPASSRALVGGYEGDMAASTPGSATVGNGLVAGNEIASPGAFAEVGGAADIGGVAGGAEAGGGSYLGYVAPVLAAIAGQHMMSSATDRRTMEGGKQGADVGKGHRTGDIFSGNFFTEPWMAWGEQQLGIDTPTAGEKTDASIDRMREGKGGFSDFMSTVPGTAYQWFDPVGNFAGDFMGDKFGTAGKVATGILLPHTNLKWMGDWLSGLF